MPTAGGGYAFAYNALGSFWGFIAGWLLGLGSIFACAMYAMGFGYYCGSLLPFPLPETALKGIGFTIIAVLTLLNCRGTKGGDRIQKECQKPDQNQSFLHRHRFPSHRAASTWIPTR